MAWSLKVPEYPRFIEPVLLNFKQAVETEWATVDEALYGADSPTAGGFRHLALGPRNEVLYPFLMVRPFASDVPETADGALRDETHRIIFEFVVRDVQGDVAAIKGMRYARILDALIEGLAVEDVAAGIPTANRNRVFWQVLTHRYFDPQRVTITHDATRDADLAEGIAGMPSDAAEDKPWLQIVQLPVEVKLKEAFFTNLNQ